MNLILHGSWHSNALFVWAEASEPAPRPRGRKPRILPHPHAAPPDALRATLARLVPSIDGANTSPTTRTILLPSSAEAPLLPPWLVTEQVEPAEAEPRLSPWTASGLVLDPLSALDLLVALPFGPASQQQWGPDLRYWSLVAKLGLELLAQHKYLPGLAENEGQYRAVWLPVLGDPQDRAQLRVLAQAMPPVCRALFDGDAAPHPDDAPLPNTLLDEFLKQLVDQAIRDWGRDNLDRRRKAPQGVAGAWWSALWNEDGQIEVPVAQRRELVRLFDDWQAWMGQLRGEAEAAFRLCFRLEPP
ncbi:MAG: hypothetical protein PVH17_12495, partial [Anaerolineae bacterium]